MSQGILPRRYEATVSPPARDVVSPSPVGLATSSSAAETMPAVRAARRMEGAAFVAFAGLAFTELLTEAEVGACKRQGAVMDTRAGCIVDTFAEGVCVEIARLLRCP